MSFKRGIKDKEKRLVRCPRCGKIGKLQYKSVRHYYYPKASSSKIERLKANERELQNKLIKPFYRAALEMSSVSLKKRVRINGKRDAVKSKVMRYLYVAHYDKDKYKQKGHGLRWCYIPIKGRVKKSGNKKLPKKQYDKELIDIYDRQTDRFKKEFGL